MSTAALTPAATAATPPPFTLPLSEESRGFVRDLDQLCSNMRGIITDYGNWISQAGSVPVQGTYDPHDTFRRYHHVETNHGVMNKILPVLERIQESNKSSPTKMPAETAAINAKLYELVTTHTQLGTVNKAARDTLKPICINLLSRCAPLLLIEALPAKGSNSPDTDFVDAYEKGLFAKVVDQCDGKPMYGLA